jgi:peptidoglycan/LPS O-acetylase OafA/YrhL
LYPPYLFALALYLAMMASTSGINLTHFFVYDIVMHLLMLHNLDPHTCYSINGVFWTLAIEEQLYLAYFGLLFMRIRWGWRTALAVCLSARVGWFFLSYFAYRLYNIGIPVGEAAASHWLTWALGAISVEAAVGLITLPNWCRDIRLGVLMLGGAVALTFALPVIDQNGYAHMFGMLALHPIWGLGFFVLVNFVVRAEKNWRAKLRTPVLVRIFAYVGIFSYSLYLTHQLVVMVSWRFTVNGWSPLINTVLIVTPVCVAFAWAFFQFFEKPFMKPQSRKVPLEDDKATPLKETASA